MMSNASFEKLLRQAVFDHAMVSRYQVNWPSYTNLLKIAECRDSIGLQVGLPNPKASAKMAHNIFIW